MEKYSTWRDPATGIHPFLPVQLPVEYAPATIFYYVVGFCLATIRFPLLLLCLSSWISVNFFVNILQYVLPKTAVRRILRITDSLFGHATLFLLGFLYIPRRQMSFRPSQSNITDDNLMLTLAKTSSGTIHPGDILICNSQSPIDILFLCTYYSPTFVIVDVNGKVVGSCSRWSYLMCGANVAPPSKDQNALKKIIAGSDPIVIFPEGSTSNGRAILPFIADLSTLPVNQRLHIFGLKFIASDGHFYPTLPASSLVRMLAFTWRCCSQWYNTLTVKYLDSDSIYACKHIPTPPSSDFNKSLQNVMVSLLHTRTVSLSLTEKAAFLQAYNRKRK